jgi:hypothetical protein
MRLFLTTAATVALLSGAASATTYVLDFTGSGVVPSSFGDNAEVDLTYRAFAASGWGLTQPNAGSVNFWTSGYGNLPGAAWTNPNGSRGEIRIEAATATDPVSIDSFDMGDWFGDQDAQWYIYDLAGNELLQDSGTAPTSGGRLSVTPGVSAQGGLVFQWGEDAWDIGLQNFQFTVGQPSTPVVVSQQSPNPGPQRPSVVPVPAAAPLLLTGAALLGAMRLRRRRG